MWLNLLLQLILLHTHRTIIAIVKGVALLVTLRIITGLSGGIALIPLLALGFVHFRRFLARFADRTGFFFVFAGMPECVSLFQGFLFAVFCRYKAVIGLAFHKFLQLGWNMASAVICVLRSCHNLRIKLLCGEFVAVCRCEIV